jgi:MtN3 and saliva related transmembrane protein
MDGVEYLGFLATGLATLAFLPQVVKTWRTRSAQDFSLVTLLMLLAGTSLWIFYGLFRGAPAIWLGNGLTLALLAVILSVKLRNLPWSVTRSAASAHRA